MIREAKRIRRSPLLGGVPKMLLLLSKDENEMIREIPIIREGEWSVTAPPSKSYTHRALIIGALGEGETILHDPLFSEDTQRTLSALETLGATIRESRDQIWITGKSGELKGLDGGSIDCGDSGSSLRFLSSLALLCDSPVTLTGSQRLQERPIGDLGEAIRSLGGVVDYWRMDGYPPLTLSGRLRGGEVTIRGDVSSQFISSLLLAAPYADEDLEIRVSPRPVSAAYLDMTLSVMERFGAKVVSEGSEHFHISSHDLYRGREYQIEGDYTSASYFFAIPAICGGRILVRNLDPRSVQGDRHFLTLLEEIGCTVRYRDEGISVERTGDIQGIEIDMRERPDTVQTLAIIATMASSPTTITGITHLRFKESDRLNKTAEQIRALGGRARVREGGLEIIPTPLHGALIDPADDHRTAMSFAILGLAIPGIRIKNPGCVAKSFPLFWETLDKVTL